ncbi:carboxymuconolactone decarboxylase [Dechloromonas denitrificans]|uniref:Carboxymuconolactone decarboxylase n=1 Tax=Dechloromonas denitrificans TaxID=281362 RepID=A0A133XDA8_9RHOO|nr:carboxymuconolactone decarboxylase family protein [Dechloromonas denitrificans]KXB28924.1 carboxymuconolactone decarboxylase [Dechloromonas denitrificans]
MKHALLLLLLMPVFSSSFAETAGNELNASANAAGHAVSATILRSASRTPYEAPSEHFTGKARVVPLFSPNAPARASAAYVTFAPGARTDWHTHPLGQTLVVTEGSGLIQFWDGPIQRIERGDVVSIPPGQKHWHGASATAAMTHLAIQEQVDGKSVAWLEKVTDSQYRIRPSAKEGAAPAVQPSRAQQLMGDFAPKLAELTDNVLYAEIWERPGLSQRDRSLVTVSALIALNRPDQLRSHLALATKNGLTHEELAEAITHLAFYSGWPSAVSAVSVAKEVLPAK